MTPDPSTGTPGGPIPLRRALLPTCREMSAHTSMALDRPPGWKVRFGMRLHLLFCRLCRRYARQLRWINGAAAASVAAATVPTPPSVPDPAAERRRERLHQRLRAEVPGRPEPRGTSPNAPDPHP